MDLWPPHDPDSLDEEIRTLLETYDEETRFLADPSDDYEDEMVARLSPDLAEALLSGEAIGRDDPLLSGMRDALGDLRRALVHDPPASVVARHLAAMAAALNSELSGCEKGMAVSEVATSKAAADPDLPEEACTAADQESEGAVGGGSGSGTGGRSEAGGGGGGGGSDEASGGGSGAGGSTETGRVGGGSGPGGPGVGGLPEIPDIPTP